MKKSRLDYCFLTCSKAAIISIILIAIIASVSCSSALYTPSESQQTASASLAQLQEGRKLYVQKCGSCHALYLPEKYTKLQWQQFLNEMQQKASIDNLEKEQILKYVSKGL